MTAAANADRNPVTMPADSLEAIRLERTLRLLSEAGRTSDRVARKRVRS